MSLGYFCDLSSAATGVRMHIMHIAMVVMKIVTNIVLPLYKTWRGTVKPGGDSQREQNPLARCCTPPYDRQNEHIRCCMELFHHTEAEE